MRRQQNTSYPYSHDYTAEIEMLRQAVVALTYHQPGDLPSPSALDEAIEAVAVAFLKNCTRSMRRLHRLSRSPCTSSSGIGSCLPLRPTATW
jgi:hypothetical protein